MPGSDRRALRSCLVLLPPPEQNRRGKIIGLLYKRTHGIVGAVTRVSLAVPVGELVPLSPGAGNFCWAGDGWLFLSVLFASVWGLLRRF